MPLLKARQALKGVDIGQCIEVLATDPSSTRDFHRMAELTDNTLLSFEQDQQCYRYVLQKGSET
jgi:TusA-related sulfurtransferase